MMDFWVSGVGILFLLLCGGRGGFGFAFSDGSGVLFGVEVGVVAVADGGIQNIGYYLLRNADNSTHSGLIVPSNF